MQGVLSSLVGCVLLCVAARVAMAQQPAMQRELLLFREVPTVVTATRRAQPLTQAPSAITVITAEEIRQSGATSLPELLRAVPGLDFFRISAADVRIAARGLNREFPVRMQVLLDGLSIQEDVRGFISWHDIPVPLEEIERIEIVRSPATALYGDRAFAGVVHIITKSPEALKRSLLSLTGGEADTVIYSGIYAGVSRNFSYKVSGGYERFNEFPNPAIGRTGNAAGREEGRVHFQVNYRLSEDSQISLSGGSLDFVKARYMLGDFTAQLAYHHADGEIVPERNIEDPDFRFQVYEAQFQHSLPWGRAHVLTGGLTYRYHTFDAQSLGGYGEQNLLDFFLQNEWRVRENLTLTVGVGVNVHPQAGVAASPRGSLVYAPWQDHTFRLAVGRAVRNPSVFETFLTLTSIDPALAPQRFTIRSLGNPDLRPEEMLAYEVGYQGLFWERLRVRLESFTITWIS
jgi:iron complex outermembrane receptor protein